MGKVHIKNYKKHKVGYSQKRTLDIILSLTGLILLSPLMAIISALIIFDSGLPIIFMQKRVGKGKKIFVMYKFRSMVQNAESLQEKYVKLNEAQHPTFKISNDPRLTRIGKKLRKYHLDELPNLFNVLRGDMSIVGFRPPTENELDSYKKEYFKRFEGEAGITSFWTTEIYHKCTFEDWIKSDIKYQKESSIKTDFHIIKKTFTNILKGVWGNIINKYKSIILKNSDGFL